MAVLGLEALDGITGEVEEEASRALIEHYGGASGSGGTSLSLDTRARPDGGFSATPHSRTAFVENLFFGLRAMRHPGLRPRYARSHALYVRGLQNANGGFRRSRELGVSSLEYTFYAVSALQELSGHL